MRSVHHDSELLCESEACDPPPLCAHAGCSTTPLALSRTPISCAVISVPSGYAPPPHPWMSPCPCCLYNPCDCVLWVAAACPHRYVGYCTSDAYIGSADARPCESAWMRRGDECSCSLRTTVGVGILSILLRRACLYVSGLYPAPHSPFAPHNFVQCPSLAPITHAWTLLHFHPPSCVPRAPCLRVLQPPLGSASMAERSWMRCLPPCETSLAWAASPTPPSCTG